jgi:hypothetical protein
MSPKLRTNIISHGLKRMILRPIVALLAAVSTSAVANPLPLTHGESMVFRVGWGLFGHAGEIRVAALGLTESGEHQISTTTSTRGFLRGLFPFEAHAEAVYDGTGRLLLIRENSQAKKKSTQTLLAFDYEHGKAAYTDALRPDRSIDLPLPPGRPLDLITSLIQTRTWNLKPGEKQDALVIFDDDLYDLTIHAVAYEQLRTPLGTFQTLKLVPRMEKTEPKGMFKRGSKVSVWISQDELRLTVRFEVEFKFGSGIATLVEHQMPPAAPPPSARE